MPVKEILSSRNAATAASLAAFITIEDPSRRRSVSRASSKSGNVSRSGASKVSLPMRVKSRAPTPEFTRCGHESAAAMGVRMSGSPNSAITAPSSKATIEWITDSGCTTTSMRSSGKSKSHEASITSSPLFIRVALSTLILRPMLHFGCLTAIAGVMPSSVFRPRNGPPEAVRMILARLRALGSAAARH